MRLADNLCTRGRCHLGGPVAGAVVDNDDSIAHIQVAAQSRHQLPDCRLLVKARNDDPKRFSDAGRHTLIDNGRLLLVGDSGGQAPMNAFRIACPHEHDRSSGSRSIRVRIRRRTRSLFELITARTSVALTGAICGSASVPAS